MCFIYIYKILYVFFCYDYILLVNFEYIIVATTHNELIGSFTISCYIFHISDFFEELCVLALLCDTFPNPFPSPIPT